MELKERSTLKLFPLDNYSFGKKESDSRNRTFFKDRLERLKQSYAVNGMGRAVETVLLVHLHNHPHVLLLKQDNAFFLPSGSLDGSESDEQGVSRILKDWLSVESGWQLKDILGVWWRPNYETYTYPYCPPHISRPKEQIRIFLVELPEQIAFSVSKDFNLIAVPLFEIFENSQHFGPFIASLPSLLSRFDFVPLPSSPPSAIVTSADPAEDQNEQIEQD